MTNEKNQFIYLTTKQVIAINTMQIQVYSSAEQIGVKEPGLLDSAINSPKQTVFENDAYPTISEMAAALTESLSKNHPFHNANKRTALASLIIFLKLNGYTWTMDVESEQDFIVNIVINMYTFPEIISIIEKHMIKV